MQMFTVSCSLIDLKIRRVAFVRLKVGETLPPENDTHFGCPSRNSPRKTGAHWSLFIRQRRQLPSEVTPTSAVCRPTVRIKKNGYRDNNCCNFVGIEFLCRRFLS
jgi:hypothetical protein